ncbi:MAG: hypothetical protein ACTSXQ_03920 [Alphaproteobacteria bacterium]
MAGDKEEDEKKAETVSEWAKRMKKEGTKTEADRKFLSTTSENTLTTVKKKENG